MCHAGVVDFIDALMAKIKGGGYSYFLWKIALAGCSLQRYKDQAAPCRVDKGINSFPTVIDTDLFLLLNLRVLFTPLCSGQSAFRKHLFWLDLLVMLS